nr:helix-turn-helix domain-containing protein [Sulfobacillus harzensis]
MAAISDRDWKTLCVIALHMDADGHCYPSLLTIARALGVNKSTASSRIQALLQFRWQGQPVVQAMRERRADGTSGRQVYTILPLTPLSFGRRTPDPVRVSTSSRNPELAASSRFTKLDASKLGNPERNNKIPKQQKPLGKQDPKNAPFRQNAEPTVTSSQASSGHAVGGVVAYLQDHLRQAGMRTFPRQWIPRAERRVRQMFEDGLTAGDLTALIDWCLVHPFWRNKITSMDKVADLVGEWQLQGRGTHHGTGVSPSAEAGRHDDSGALDALVVRTDASATV